MKYKQWRFTVLCYGSEITKWEKIIAIGLLLTIYGVVLHG